MKTGYDQNDNPLHHLVSQAEWTGAGGGRDNVHSFKFGYDRLDRLTRSDQGKLNAALDAIETSGTNVPMPVLSRRASR